MKTYRIFSASSVDELEQLVSAVLRMEGWSLIGGIAVHQSTAAPGSLRAQSTPVFHQSITAPGSLRAQSTPVSFFQAAIHDSEAE